MGASIARRLMREGHSCVVHDLSRERVAALARDGARGAREMDELVAALEPPRTVWLTMPAGEPTTQAIEALAGRLERGALVVDGGDTHYLDDRRHGLVLASRGVGLVDSGTSGGVLGLERGFCLMVGGDRRHFQRLEPIFQALSPGGDGGLPAAGQTASRGYLHTGPAGSGHFVKMVHDAIEYVVMQALGEGFELMRAAADLERQPSQRFELDVAAIAELWRHGSVVRSWLLDLTAQELAKDARLARFEGRVDDPSEGCWAARAALEEGVPVPALAGALFNRYRHRSGEAFGNKVLSALRHACDGGFGIGSSPSSNRAGFLGRRGESPAALDLVATRDAG
jgi:6-phosphogluconate dehydrogenase